MDANIERDLKAIDDTDTRVQVGDSSHKWLRTDGDSRSTEEGSGRNLIRRRKGKRLVTSKKEPTPLVPSNHHKTQAKSATTPIDVSILALSSLGTLTSLFAPSMLHSFVTSLRHPSTTSIRTSGLLPWRNCFSVGQPPFSPTEINQ